MGMVGAELGQLNDALALGTFLYGTVCSFLKLPPTCPTANVTGIPSVLYKGLIACLFALFRRFHVMKSKTNSSCVNRMRLSAFAVPAANSSNRWLAIVALDVVI